MHTKTAEGQKKTNETDWLPHNFCTNTNEGQGLRVREGDDGGRQGNRGSRPIASRDNGMFLLLFNVLFSTSKLFKTIEQTTTATMNVHLNAPPHLESSTRQATITCPVTQGGHVTTCFEPHMIHIAHRHQDQDEWRLETHRVSSLRVQ